MRFLWNLVNSLENLPIIPLGNVRHFRRIRKIDALFLKMCVFFVEFSELFGKSANYTRGKRAQFSQNSQKLCIFLKRVRKMLATAFLFFGF